MGLPGKPGRDSVPAALACHFAFWFGLVCATPTFIALNNPEDVVFRPESLLAWTAGAALLLSALGWGAARLAGERFSWWLNRCLLAAALVFAVQGNIVHDLFYYGAFNGERVAGVAVVAPSFEPPLAWFVYLNVNRADRRHGGRTRPQPRWPFGRCPSSR